jgi:hypothetical protein
MVNNIVESDLFEDFKYLSKQDLVSNEHIPNKKEIEKAQYNLQIILNILERYSLTKKSIVIIKDQCFTNYLLEKIIKKII